MRARLLAAVSLSVLAAAPALADEEINAERTEPISTSDADGQGNADNIIIGADGRVVLTTPGPAVTLDSNNSVTLSPGAEIITTDVDNSTGVEIQGGNQGTFTHGGRIDLSDSFEPGDDGDGGDDDRIDADGDGERETDLAEADGPFAEDSGKIGIHVTGTQSFVGDLVAQAGSSLRVEGQDSFGLLVEESAGVDGDILLEGTINLLGENSTAVALRGDTTGDVRIGGQIGATSPGGEGVAVDGDIGGGLHFTGTVSTTGYRVPGRLEATRFRVFDAGDDDLDSGSAVRVSGNVANGIFVRGASQDARAGEINVRSQAPALAIQPSDGGTGDVTIGLVNLPEGVDPDREDAADRQLAYGIVIDGQVAAEGVFDGKNATAILLSGSEDGLRRLLVEGGFQNTGNIGVVAYDATATGIRFAQGMVTPVFLNSGEIRATTRIGHEDDGFADDALGEGEVYVLIVEQGADLERIVNSGILFAQIEGDGARGATILVQSDLLTEIENTAVISMRAPNLVEGAEVETVAIDARAHTAGLTIRQHDADTEDEATPTILGNIYLGSGDDTIRSEAGTLTGDIEFGAGEDLFELRNTDFTGALHDSDSRLVIDAENSRLSITGGQSLSLTSARFGDGATLDISLTNNSLTHPLLDASGEIRFETGSAVSVGLSELIGDGQTFTLISAGDLFFADEAATLSTTDAPFLYRTTLTRGANDPESLVLTLSRKTADELGMNANQARAYEPAFAAFNSVDALGAAIASLRTRSDFFSAYDQLLPEYASSAIQFALASNDAAQGALAARLQNARLAPDNLAGLWAQEFGYFADRNGSGLAPGYRGEGVGLAVGIDRPVGPFYAVGVNIVGAASEIEEIEGFDEPMIALTGQLGGYAAMDLGGWDISGAAALGYDSFETERNIIVGSFSSTSRADWSGWHATASAQLGRDLALGEWVVRPEASLTWLSLFESGYSESTELAANEGLALVVDDRESSTLTAAATLAIARRFGSDTSWWAPSLRVGYRSELAGDIGETTARFGQDGQLFTLRGADMPGSGALVGLGLSAGSNYSTFTFAYDADVREDFIRHVARLIIRLTF
ncbi:autotransporter outer membrane beta-barrel domain-containing protein [Marinicauda algicola]|uniref:Autotransporter outer membrane beta-barrel domain-containing protein n=1 Tax=Marinicauda algicola TaxID=2029849 RepID=A0A4S2H2L3_9PROT|nr:autotransporter outer membrane beta-barrel domain-containing protein [Marinicauda algicola]TGY89571.1 autotransporter outer membrane beta-barrel domain-containing protein [Marinicauda algicola]